jgi:hypothetical protein
MECRMHGLAVAALFAITGLLCRFAPSDKRRSFFRIDARNNFEAVLLQAFDDIDERQPALRFWRSPLRDHPRNKLRDAGGDRQFARCTDGGKGRATNRDLKK